LLFDHLNVGVKTLHSTIIPNLQDMQSRLLFPQKPWCSPQTQQMRPITRNEPFLPV